MQRGNRTINHVCLRCAGPRGSLDLHLDMRFVGSDIVWLHLFCCEAEKARWRDRLDWQQGTSKAVFDDEAHEHERC